MKLNLGCGNDVRAGYVNVDFFDGPNGITRVDLSKLPWPFADSSADEILMLDFLEHFPYRQTNQILQEAWRVLKARGLLIIQVPDFEECSLAMLQESDRIHSCNKCGTALDSMKSCHTCYQTWIDIADAAMNRLYGGQDRDGNWHYAAFTKATLATKLHRNGFTDISFPVHNQNAETYAQNWNIMVHCRKNEDLW